MGQLQAIPSVVTVRGVMISITIATIIVVIQSAVHSSAMHGVRIAITTIIAVEITCKVLGLMYV